MAHQRSGWIGFLIGKSESGAAIPRTEHIEARRQAMLDIRGHFVLGSA